MTPTDREIAFNFNLKKEGFRSNRQEKQKIKYKTPTDVNKCDAKGERYRNSIGLWLVH